MKESATTKDESPSRLIDARIRELDDWRGKTLIHAAVALNRSSAR
jgi:hypothetical protein